MDTSKIETAMGWAPEACTLPTAERPLRIAEFDALFVTALRGADRRSPTRLELLLDGSAEVEATTRDLVARETQCCSFFTFNLTRVSAYEDEGGERLRGEVSVPAPYVSVLDGLAARAADARRATA